MQRVLLIALILGVTLFGLVQPAAAAEPPSSCPPGFHTMDAAMLDMEMHNHIGTARDINGNGTVCVKHLSETTHLVIDDFIP
jgi:hypothetical protein